MSELWMPIDHGMPDIIEYCLVTSGYQSKVVRVKLRDGTEYDAALQLYGSSLRGWNSEWWERGMLSSKIMIDGDNVICWRELDSTELACSMDGYALSFAECLVVTDRWDKIKNKE